MLALILDSAGFGEWFVLLAVVLIVVGPKQLPSTARKLGQYYNRFRRAAESFKRQLLDMDAEFTRASEGVKSATEDAFRVEGDEASAEPADAPESSPYPGHEPGPSVEQETSAAAEPEKESV